MARRLDGAPAIFAALERHHPDADTELHFRTPFELLVATVLSAQSTDRRVNEATPALFARYPTPAALATADPIEVEALVHSTGFFRQKAKAVIGLSQALAAKYGGTVPADLDALVQLPGVGRKTANVVLGHALGVPGFPVDRHVLRVAARLGLIHTDDPVKAEGQLTALLPKARWTRASDTLILHGRRICTPTPKCDLCHARTLCPYAVTSARPDRVRAAAKVPAKAAKTGATPPRPATARGRR
ncbi:MAG TPA: endonuclease III [Vicinamibacterales bacterium]|nr:endonuclease III [Vicinamibacterales bacterium]